MPNSLMQTLASVQTLVSLVFGILLLVVGTVGGVLNILVFTRRLLLRTTCGHYFLVASIASIGNLLSIQFMRLMALIPYSIFATKTVQCQIRIYFGLVTAIIANVMVILTLIDRLLLSSPNIQTRLWASVKIARRSVVVTILIGFLLPLHIPFLYGNAPSGSVCLPIKGVLDIYNIVFTTTIVVFGPIFLMIILSTMLIYRLRSQTIRRDRNNILHRSHLRDSHLTRMIIMQVIFYTILRSPYPINYIYMEITEQTIKSTERLAVENFINFVINTTLVGCYYACIFFIHTCTSPLFRKQLELIFRSCWRRQTVFVIQRNNRVVPMVGVKLASRQT